MPKKFFAPIVILLVLAINLFLGLTRLESYSAVDEPYWTYGRTSKFWKALDSGELKRTDVNDKPGITVAILSGFGLLKHDPMQYKILRERTKTDEQLATINSINFYFRLPIFLFTLVMLPLFYFFLKKLFGPTIALLSFVLIAFSPILLGVSLIINPDSLLWLFMPLSLLAYFIFLKDQDRRYLITSGVLLGFSLLTKYVSNLLIIFYLLLPFAEYVFTPGEKQPLRSYFKQALLDYLLLIFLATLTYFVFFPATWIDLEKLLEGTFLSKAFKTTWPVFAAFFAALGLDWLLLKSKATGWILAKLTRFKQVIFISLATLFLGLALFAMADTYLGMRPFDLPTILASPKNSENNPLLALKSVGNIVADFYSLAFGISPLALFGMLFAVATLTLRKKLVYSRLNLTVFYLAALIIFYYLASTVNHVVATVRYQIALYPFALIMAAIGIYKFLEFIKFTQTKHKIAAITLTAFISLLGIFYSRPHYFAYSSSLLPQDYFVNYKDMGDGSFEAAQYLNSLPNAKELNIWSDKGAVCAVFVGECSISYLPKVLRKQEFDYVVVSTGRKAKDLKLSISRGAGSYIDFKKAHETSDTDFKIEIAGRPDNYVKVIATEKLTVSK